MSGNGKMVFTVTGSGKIKFYRYRFLPNTVKPIFTITGLNFTAFTVLPGQKNFRVLSTEIRLKRL